MAFSTTAASATTGMMALRSVCWKITIPGAHPFALAVRMESAGNIVIMPLLASRITAGSVDPPCHTEVRVSALGVGWAAPRGSGRQGRPALQLKISSQRGYLLGIDIGADKVISRVATLAGETLATVRTGTRKPSARHVLKVVRATVESSLAEAGEAMARVEPTIAA